MKIDDNLTIFLRKYKFISVYFILLLLIFQNSIFFGDFDHEFWLTVKTENISSVILYLIKNRFKTDTEFREWLDEKNIQFEFYSYT